MSEQSASALHLSPQMDAVAQFPALLRTSAIPTPADAVKTATPMRKSRPPGPADHANRLMRHTATMARIQGQKGFFGELFMGGVVRSGEALLTNK